MKETVIVDGKHIKVVLPEQKGNPSIYNPNSDSGTQEIIQPNELTETLKEINMDVIEPENNMSSMDMKSRLTHTQVLGIVRISWLSSVGFLPEECRSLGRSVQRNSISINGLGRRESIEIVSGIQEQKKQGGIGEKIRQFIGGNK